MPGSRHQSMENSTLLRLGKSERTEKAAAQVSTQAPGDNDNNFLAGPALGPLQYIYNSVLKLYLPIDATIVGFVKGVAIVVVTNCVAQVEMKTNEAVAKVTRG